MFLTSIDFFEPLGMEWVKMAKKTQFQFVNYSGTYQLRLETADDLLAIPLLDEQFWMATSAPTYQLACDKRLIEFLDQDRDGRIMSRDVRRALAWLRERLSVLDGVTAGCDILKLDHIRADTPGGRAILVSARRVLHNLGKSKADSVSLLETRSHQLRRADGVFGGTGVIPLGDVADEQMSVFLNDVSVAVGAVPSRNGKPGIDSGKLDAFLKSATELLIWRKAADESGEKLFPLGDATSSAYVLFNRIRPQIDRYFSLCRLLIQNRMMQRQNPALSCPVDILESERRIEDFLESDPIARPEIERLLDLRGEINPAFLNDLQALETQALIPLLGPGWVTGCLSEDEWKRVKSLFAPYENWLAAKSGGEAEKIDAERLREYINGELPNRLRDLIIADLKTGEDLSAVQDLEYLIVLQEGFLGFCNNFVSFHNLYDPEHHAMFEAGRLVISGRVFNFSMHVQDPDAHSRAAVKSGMFLMYSEVTGSDLGEKYVVATPVTALTTRRLGVDRRGVFFDRAGREWDARVIKVVDNPVSLRQAVAQPFIRIGNVISNSFERIISGTEKHIESGLSDNMGRVETGLKGASSPRPAGDLSGSKPGGGAREWVFTGSVAVAALGSSFAFIVKTLSGFNWSGVLTTLLAGLAVILIPLILIADFRLSRRNLSGLLEASGWAINSEMRLSRSLAKILSPEPRHPAGFALIRRDRTLLFLRKLRAALNGQERGVR